MNIYDKINKNLEEIKGIAKKIASKIEAGEVSDEIIAMALVSVNFFAVCESLNSVKCKMESVHGMYDLFLEIAYVQDPNQDMDRIKYKASYIFNKKIENDRFHGGAFLVAIKSFVRNDRKTSDFYAESWGLDKDKFWNRVCEIKEKLKNDQQTTTRRAGKVS